MKTPACALIVSTLCILFSKTLSSPFQKLLLTQLQEQRKWANETLASLGEPYRPSEDYPYFNFMPQYLKTMKPGSPSVWESNCFKTNKATMVKSEDGKQLEINIASTLPTALKTACSEEYLILSAFVMKVVHVNSIGLQPVVNTQILIDIPEDATDAELWDLDEKGLRLMKFVEKYTTSLANIIKTIDLFLPEFTTGVPEQVARANIDFMSKYTHFEIKPVDPASFLIPDESEVKSGDTFYIMRLDGLNPMLGWAMGGTTGHVTSALWIDGELYVVESTVDTSYWPTNGVQKTPYRQWMQQAIDADFQVVFAPLSDTARANYNESAAIKFFNSVQGLDYGYRNMLFGWIDSALGNFQCLPPDFASNCMQWELFEPLLAYVDRKVPQIGDLMWNGAFNVRLGTKRLRTAATYMEAAKKGMASIDMFTMVELDSYVYETTRDDEPAEGKSMVCCVMACNMWKAAGVFGDLADDVNCGELTNFDDYALTVHGPGQRQIIGAYTLELNSYRSRDPYAHMAEHCAALAPDYSVSPAGC